MNQQRDRSRYEASVEAAEFVPPGAIARMANKGQASAKSLLACSCFLCSMLACAAGSAGRVVQKLVLPSGQTAVVAEGDFEARSIGSYSLRIYSVQGAQAKGETTFFLSGIIRPRDGTVEKVFLADLGDGNPPSLVVALRSAGSGGYWSADAFTIGQNTIGLVASVAGMPPDTDLVVALKSVLQHRK